MTPILKQPVPTYTDIDLPHAPFGFRGIARAADAEMWDVLTDDFTGDSYEDAILENAGLL
jgi:hypothetical protein